MFDFSRRTEVRRLFLDPYTGLSLERAPRSEAAQ
jgi:hypothetical protein